jgi:hypothetical protein
LSLKSRIIQASIATSEYTFLPRRCGVLEVAVRAPANPEPLHFVGERSAPHAKFNSGTLSAADYPTDLAYHSTGY